MGSVLRLFLLFAIPSHECIFNVFLFSVSIVIPAFRRILLDICVQLSSTWLGRHPARGLSSFVSQSDRGKDHKENVLSGG